MRTFWRAARTAVAKYSLERRPLSYHLQSRSYWEMARKTKRLRVEGSNVPPEKRKAIIEARKANDVEASLNAIKSLLSEENVAVPAELATVALSTLCNADKLEGDDLMGTIQKLYADSKENSPDEAFFSTATRVFLRLDSFDSALQVVNEMKAAGHSPRHRTYSPVLSKACESIARLRFGRGIYQEMIRSQPESLLFEEDASVILEACAKARKALSSSNGMETTSSCSSSSADGEPLSDSELLDWVEEVLRDCSRRATDPPSERLIDGARSFFALSLNRPSPAPRPLDAENRCQSCGSVMRSLEPDDGQLTLVLKQTEALAPLQNEKKKGEWEKFIQWEGRNLAKYDTVVDGANISYFRAASSADSDPKYEQADQVMKKLKEMGRKPLLFFHARHFSKNGIPRDLEGKWRSDQALFVVPHGHNDDVFWLHMSLKMGPKNWMVTNDQMRDHRFEMIQSTCAFARWKERHHCAYDVVWNDSDKKLSVQVYPPLKYSAQIQSSDQGKWHFPVRVPMTEEETQLQEEKARLKTKSPGELRQLMTSGKISFELFREIRREALGCELPKTYGKNFEWLCL